jgi:GNAT superfamily N-acetyltransferase
MHKLVNGTIEDRTFIDDKIVEFNNRQVPFTQSENFIDIDYVIKEGDVIVAGITAVLYCWKCLYINVLWVDEKYRNKGLGKELLKRTEDRAKELGCPLSHLDTFDFQAKDFYLKHGYVIFGELEDCPPNHKRFYLKKSL